MFGVSDKKRKPTLRQRLIAYIRKYSLEKLLLYIVVEDVETMRVPDSEAPYITLVTNQMENIKQYILSATKR
ncbi:unnamed protein product [Sphagnum balticum]